MGLFGRHLQLIGLEFVVDIPLGGDEHLSFGLQILDQVAFILDGQTDYTHIVVRLKGIEPQNEINFPFLDACVVKY
jgi:hypothetical protein